MTTDERTTEARTGPSPVDRPGPSQYEIRVSGHLGARWAAWFDGMRLVHEDDGTTVIHGGIVDQAALHGLLQKLRDLGIPLISLTPVPIPDPARRHHHDDTTTPTACAPASREELT